MPRLPGWPSFLELLGAFAVAQANYPDVMMSGYNENRFYGLYFVLFKVLMVFIMQNLLLSVVANNVTWIPVPT